MRRRNALLVLVVEEEFRRLRKVHADNSCEQCLFATADTASGLGLDAETRKAKRRQVKRRKRGGSEEDNMGVLCSAVATRTVASSQRPCQSLCRGCALLRIPTEVRPYQEVSLCWASHPNTFDSTAVTRASGWTSKRPIPSSR